MVPAEFIELILYQWERIFILNSNRIQLRKSMHMRYSPLFFLTSIIELAYGDAE